MASNSTVRVENTEPDPASPQPWRGWTLWLIGGLLAFRTLYAAVVPLDLVHDEAYYWDWSRQLDWGYYSKPPMVAWLIGLSTRLAGDSTLAVRLPAVVLGTGVLWLVYLLAARLYGARAGFWAVLLMAATPGGTALSLLMTIDAPLLFCWCAALYGFWRTLERGNDRRRWLALTMLAAGLGFLSKQTMLGFLPLAGVFLILSPRDRAELWRPGFWLFAAGSLLFLTPVVWWNVRHGWITAEHTGGHFSAAPVSWLKHLAQFGEFLAGQFGVGSPITAGLFAAVAVLGLGSLRRLERRELFLLCFSALPVLGVLGLAFRQRIEPNWPAAFYPAGVILVAGWGLGLVRGLRRLKTGRRALQRAAAVGAVCVVVTYAFPFVPGLAGSKLDPGFRLRGWRAVGQAMSEQLARQPRPNETLLVFTTDRAAAAESAFYMREHPPVFLWNDSGRIRSQYDVWGGPQRKEGWDALIVTPAQAVPPPALAASFAKIEPHGRIVVPIGHGRQHHYAIWRGEQLRQWPTAAPLARRDSPTTRR